MIQDLTPLKTLKKLQYIYLDGNQVSDLKPLVEMTKPEEGKAPDLALFRAVPVRGNPLNAAAKTSEIPELRKTITRLEADG